MFKAVDSTIELNLVFKTKDQTGSVENCAFKRKNIIMDVFWHLLRWIQRCIMEFSSGGYLHFLARGGNKLQRWEK